MSTRLDDTYVLQRVDDLNRSNQDQFRDKWRIRSIMDGGPDGVIAVMLWDKGGRDRISRDDALRMIGTDLPTVNLALSGLDRLGQMVGRLATLKPPKADDLTQRERNQRRIEILDMWDAEQKLELMMPQLARWLPGYSFGFMSMTQGKNSFGEWYPKLHLRDSYDVSPGYFGADQSPKDVVANRVVPLYQLKHIYPELPWDTYESDLRVKRPQNRIAAMDLRNSSGASVAYDGQRTWEGPRTGIRIAEYSCESGRYVVIPEFDTCVEYIPNMLDQLPFVFGKRISFNKLQSAYSQIIGLMSMHAKLNILGMIASEDSTFRETNIIGELVGEEYQRGRKGINMFLPGTRIERLSGDQAQQVWAQIDRIERQLRIGMNYDVQQDGTSPNSFATGQGMRELQTASANNVREYQTVLRYMMQDADSKRLEFAEKAYQSQKRSYWDMRGDKKTYRASTAINGDYRTRRVYGAMATFDDQLKIVVGLQLLQGQAIDVETLQENIDGLEDLPLINERIARRQAKDVLFERLRMRAEQDPRADAALTQIILNPRDEAKILVEYFAPEVEEGEEGPPMAFPPQPPGLAMGEGGAPPEAFSTVLSRLEGDQANLGVQTVGAL